MMNDNPEYIHALRHQRLNWLYDPVVALTTREALVKQRLLACLPDMAEGNLLDLGCGTGTLTRAFKLNAPKFTVCGIDGDEDMLTRAKARAAAERLKIQYDHGLVEALPYTNDSFDIVTSSLLFHHLKTAAKKDALAEARRVLKPTGTLLVADWGRPVNIGMRMLFLLVQLLDGFETTRDSVRGALPELIRGAGFKNIVELDNLATPLGTITIHAASN